MQLNHLQQTVKDPLMILNTAREPQDQLSHQTDPLYGERELRVQPLTLSPMTLQHLLMTPTQPAKLFTLRPHQHKRGSKQVINLIMQKPFIKTCISELFMPHIKSLQSETK